jgi:hypothetical protein
LAAEEQRLVGLFSAAREFTVEKTRKGDRREVDIRPLIPSLEIAAAERVELQVVNLSGQPGIKPLEALQAILHIDAETALRARIVKTAWRVLENP